MKRVRSVALVFNHMKFANDILVCRAELGMSQDDLAELLPFTGSTVSIYECGKEKNPRIGNVLALCNVFDLDIREYFELEL